MDKVRADRNLVWVLPVFTIISFIAIVSYDALVDANCGYICATNAFVLPEFTAIAFVCSAAALILSVGLFFLKHNRRTNTICLTLSVLLFLYYFAFFVSSPNSQFESALVGKSPTFCQSNECLYQLSLRQVRWDTSLCEQITDHSLRDACLTTLLDRYADTYHLGNWKAYCPSPECYSVLSDKTCGLLSAYLRDDCLVKVASHQKLDST